MANMSIESDGLEGEVTFSAGNATITVCAVWNNQSEEVQLRFRLGGYESTSLTGQWDGDRLVWIMQPSKTKVTGV